MTAREDALAVGAIIRQARRRQNLTQTQLGGTHYSKSYVSALERGKIVPSSQALEYFTEQLGLSSSLSPTSFSEVQFIHQSNTDEQPGAITIEVGQYIPNEAWHFLDTVIEQFHRIDPQALPTYPDLTLEEISSLPLKRQASFSFILGIMAQQAELYLAAGEVAEELGRSATNEAYAHHCYRSADTFFRKTIECVHAATMRHDCDTGYLLRVYQRFIALLEERSVQTERGKEATADVLLEFLKVEISTLPDLLLLPLSENA